jgi:signal transduction histidine kinase
LRVSVWLRQAVQRFDARGPSHGFGLPITRELAELYGGTLSLGMSNLVCFCAKLSLPVAR